MSKMYERLKWAAAAAAAAATAAAVLSVAGAASAQALAVRPISIEMARDQHATSLDITNSGSTPTVVQIRAFSWRQVNGEEQLTPAPDLALSPPFAQIAPGQTQLVRLVLRAPRLDQETAYRVLVDQVPQTNENGVRLAVRVSIPLFAASDPQAKAKLEWRMLVHADGQGELIAVNTGPRHVRLSQIRVNFPGRAPLLVEGGAVGYVLPGVQRTWRMGGLADPTSLAQAHVTAMSDQGAVDAAATVATAP